MKTVIGADAAKLAGLQIDLLQKIREGKISLPDLERFVRGELVLVAQEPVVQTLPDLDWLKAYQALGVKTEEYQEAIAKLQMASDPQYWTVPMIPFTRKEGKKEIRLLACNRIGQAYRDAGSGFWGYYDDLDKEVTENDRDAYRDGPYVRSFVRSVEAQQFGKCSPNDLKAREKDTEFSTLSEYLFLAFTYFLTTGKRLDIKKWTVCLDSLYRGRYFPHAYCSPDASKVEVSRYNPDYDCGVMYARPAVSLPAKPRVSAAEMATVS